MSVTVYERTNPWGKEVFKRIAHSHNNQVTVEVSGGNNSMKLQLILGGCKILINVSTLSEIMYQINDKVRLPYSGNITLNQAIFKYIEDWHRDNQTQKA